MYKTLTQSTLWRGRRVRGQGRPVRGVNVKSNYSPTHMWTRTCKGSDCEVSLRNAVGPRHLERLRCLVPAFVDGLYGCKGGKHTEDARELIAQMPYVRDQGLLEWQSCHGGAWSVYPSAPVTAGSLQPPPSRPHPPPSSRNAHSRYGISHFYLRGFVLLSEKRTSVVIKKLVRTVSTSRRGARRSFGSVIPSVFHHTVQHGYQRSTPLHTQKLYDSGLGRRWGADLHTRRVRHRASKSFVCSSASLRSNS